MSCDVLGTPKAHGMQGAGHWSTHLPPSSGACARAAPPALRAPGFLVRTTLPIFKSHLSLTSWLGGGHCASLPCAAQC